MKIWTIILFLVFMQLAMAEDTSPPQLNPTSTSLTKQADDDWVDFDHLFQNPPTKKGDFLGIGLTPSTDKHVISMCPMNSSGDIYHILAYIILARAEQKDLPSIIPTYDGKEEEQHSESKMNAYSQTQRSLGFCRWLGYGDHFKDPLALDTGKCQRQKNRQSILIDGLAAAGYTHFVDQKALTTIIAHYFNTLGKGHASRVLRAGFQKADVKKYPDLIKVIRGAEEEVKKIKTYKGQKPLVVMHVRYSSNANESQNLLFPLKGMESFLEGKGYKVWFVFADGRERGSFAEITQHRTNVFPYPHTTKKLTTANPEGLESDVDYGKFFHLHVLLGLLDIGDVRIMGNTSGTLDLAGFIGHSVYNWHNLAESINYQAARILIQSAFLAVECLPCKVVGEESSKHLELEDDVYDTTNLTAWLVQGSPPANNHVGNPTPHRNKAGYCDLYFIHNLQTGTQTILPFIG